MQKFLFNVIDTFESGEYVVALSDIPELGADYRNGDVLELRRPDGSTIQTRSEFIFYDPPADERALSVGFKGLRKADVPVGSQAWLVNAERPPRKPSRHYEEVKTPEKRRHSA